MRRGEFGSRSGRGPPRGRDYYLLLLYYGSTESGKRNSTRAHFAVTRWSRVSRSSRRFITYLAERSVVFAVAVDCRPLPRCSRCGCPAECYDHCHCSSPNLRTRPQDTSITTARSSREESRVLTRDRYKRTFARNVLEIP